jgi:hypothetical protein
MKLIILKKTASEALVFKGPTTRGLHCSQDFFFGLKGIIGHGFETH